MYKWIVLVSFYLVFMETLIWIEEVVFGKVYLELESRGGFLALWWEISMKY